jgi:hypothetical protein
MGRARAGRAPKGDPFEQRIESALQPGAFIRYRAVDDFEDGLDRVKEEIEKLGKAGEAERAVGLLEAFIAGCYLKAEELDDSGGTFGVFVQSLFCAWIYARQRAKADSFDTAQRLLGWMEKDNYGFCHRLEDDAVKALHKSGLALSIGLTVECPEMLFVTRLSTFAARATSLNVRRIARGVMFFFTPMRPAHMSKAFFKEDSERKAPSSRGKRSAFGSSSVYV